MILARLAARLAALSSWRRALAAFLFGALAVLALPPFGLFPVLIVSIAGLLWMLDGARTPRAAFALGWWFGLGFFVAGLYWISNALLVDAARFGWLVPFAVTGLSAYFALFPAAAVCLASFLRAGWPRIAGLACAWTLGEILRGILLTGFPWNPFGSAFAFHAAPMQGAAFGGVYALSFAAVLIAGLPATLAGDNAADGSARARLAPGAIALVLFASLFAGGSLRLAGAPVVEDHDAPRLRIVQGAIPQAIKWQPELVRQHFGLYLRLSQGQPGVGASNRAPVAVIWPETAVPAVFEGNPELARAIALAAPPGGIVVTGIVRREAAPAPGRRAAIWNSVLAVDGRGRVLGRYDKHHLVPFGEYVPFARFNPLPKLTEGRVDFSAGAGPVTLNLPGLPGISPLVCYEVIFPGAVVAGGAARPGALLNLTNDAWFGTATGPYQHLVAARFRAIEEGLPLVRAANTGISAMIDSYGRVRDSLALGVRGVIDAALPEPLAGSTLFSLTGSIPVTAFCLLILAVFLGFFRKPA
jgi:apolipoprotein N-acyltransferase